MPAILMLLTFFQSGDLLDAVNRERGGRHWIDQKPDPPKSASEQAGTFQIEPGSRIELVAAEPLVFDPVWIDFDHLGRMFVAEYSDYPIGPVDSDGVAQEQALPLSRIVRLDDADGDGRMDQRTVFADNLKFCHSFMPLMGGILAGAQTEILFLKDTTGDGKADVRQVWFDGFTPAHPQMQIGCPRWGADNWIYLTYAPGNIRCRRPGFESDEPVKMPRQDMRFNPLTMEFEPISGLGQFGNTIDNEGHRFFSTNRNPIMMEMIPQQTAAMFPTIAISKRHADVGPSGGDTKVFPLVAMKSNWLSHAGTHTSACGVTAYRGDLWDRQFQQSVFACEPVGHLVTRSIVHPQPGSPVLTAQRARPDADFIASTDTWFRPASLRTGPDGALYLADMYRMWVEHPKFLPPEIAAQIDWRAGDNRGRIWRISPTAGTTSRRSFRPAESTVELIQLLDDSNGWRRQMAQQRLTLSDDRDRDEQLKNWLSEQDRSPAAVRSAANILASCNSLHDGDVERLVRVDGDNPIAAYTLRMQLGSGALKTGAIEKCSRHTEPSIRYAAVLACLKDGKVSVDEQTILLPLLKRDGHQPWFQDALLMAFANAPLVALNNICDNPEDTKRETAILIEKLGEVLARQGTTASIAAALRLARQVHPEANWVTAEILRGMARGLPRNTDTKLRQPLASLLASPPPDAAAATEYIQEMLQQSATDAINHNRTTSQRLAAISLLPLRSSDEVNHTLKELLNPAESGEIQQAAINLARQAGGVQAGETVITSWKHLVPGVKNTALNLVLSRTESTALLLKEMTENRIPPSVVAIDQRLKLLQHRDKTLRDLAVQIFGGVVSADRQSVAKEYESALTTNGSAELGAAVFRKTCAKCHRIDGVGANVGPDISDTRNRSRDALLYDILDPNRRVDPQFSEYIVLTLDGRSYSGLLVSESEQQIVLRQPEGKEQTIARSEIEELQVTSRSLMPVGIEKDVSVKQMADLLEFLKAR